MKLQTAYLAYTDLTPGHENSFVDFTHKFIIKILRDNFPKWSEFFNKYGKEYSIGFYVSTKKGTNEMKLYGPSISKKLQIVDYTIFLPDEIIDLNHYIDLIFEGVGIVLSKYGVSQREILAMKEKCKRDLDL